MCPIGVEPPDEPSDGVFVLADVLDIGEQLIIFDFVLEPPESGQHDVAGLMA